MKNTQDPPNPNPPTGPQPHRLPHPATLRAQAQAP
jgi:hypothetical protein